LAAFKKLATYLLVYDDEALVATVISGALSEVASDE